MSASVFPARAGMSRVGSGAAAGAGCVPRASGDEPYGFYVGSYGSTCSPRERG